jgi:DNA-binding transcriptional ArsR family regulator
LPQPTRFGKLDEDVMKRTDLRASDKVTYTALRMFENPKTNKCNPSLAAISRATGMSKPTVSGALSRLTKAGIIRFNKEENNTKNYTLSTQPVEPQVLNPLSTSTQHIESSTQHIECPYNNDRKDLEKTSSSSPPPAEEEDADGGWGEGEVSQTYRTAVLDLWDQADPRHDDYPLAFFVRLYRLYGESVTLATLKRFVATMGTIYALNNPQAYEKYIGQMVETQADRQEEKQAQQEQAVQASDVPSYRTRIQAIKQARATDKVS